MEKRKSNRLMKISEVAKELGLSAQTIWKRVRDGNVPAINLAPNPSCKPIYRIRIEDVRRCWPEIFGQPAA